MQFGVNWIAPRTLPVIHKLLQQDIADFCEVMVDNFAHLPPKKIREALPDVPISLHIVSSRFLEKSSAELKQLASYLKPWMSALHPFYVSDHLVQFTQAGGRYLPVISELDYNKAYLPIKNRVSEWQELLGTSLLFENHASSTQAGEQQAGFFKKLLRETQSGLLFDISNAYIAELNKVCAVQAWDSLIQESKHFHVAGFRIETTTQLALDTHDAPISKEVVELSAQHIGRNKKDQTMVVEFNANFDFETAKNEILKMKNLGVIP